MHIQCSIVASIRFFYLEGGNSSRRRRGKRKSVREVEGDVADCEEEEVEHEEERSENYILEPHSFKS